MPWVKPDIFNALCVYRELGLKLGVLEKYERSLPYFDQALQRSPHDVRALMGRARYRAKCCKYSDALNDMTTLRSNDPENIYVDAVECVIKYACCEFEEAMVENLRKIPIRKKPDHFVLGVMHCEDAIRNNVGPRAGNPLRDHFLIIRKLAWKRVFDEYKPHEPKSKYKKRRNKLKVEDELQLAVPKYTFPPVERKKDSWKSGSLPTVQSSRRIDVAVSSVFTGSSSILETLNEVINLDERMPPIEKYPFRPIQRYTTNIRNLMAERYLDKMFHDKNFLHKLKKDPGVKSPNASGVDKIEGLVEKSCKYMNYNQELLRARRPYFFLRMQDTKASGKLKERQVECQMMLMRHYEGQAKNLLDKLKQGVREQNLRHVIEGAEKLYHFCENTPRKSLPNYQTYLNEIYSSVKHAFYEVKRITATKTKAQKDARIGMILGLPLEQHGSSDSLRAQFKDYFVDRKEQCKILATRVIKSTNREELAWLYHELSRLQFERKKFDLAKAYAIKCLRESHLLKDSKWTINGLFLMARTDVVNKNVTGARQEMRNCRKIANDLNDTLMLEFIDNCITALNETPIEAEPASKMLERRYNDILNLLTTDKMKLEAEMIFHRIRALPPSKRLSVLPGVYSPETKKRAKVDSPTEGRRKSIKRRHTVGTIKRGIDFLQLV